MSQAEPELQQKLLVISGIHHEVEKLVLNIGQANISPERIAEIVAGHILGDTERFHICPGYGDTHTWAYSIPVVNAGLIERCSSHPERRVNERRK